MSQIVNLKDIVEPVVKAELERLFLGKVIKVKGARKSRKIIGIEVGLDESAGEYNDEMHLNAFLVTDAKRNNKEWIYSGFEYEIVADELLNEQKKIAAVGGQQLAYRHPRPEKPSDPS